MNIVTPETFLGDVGGAGVGGEFDQFLMARNIFWVTAGAPNRSFVPFFVAPHALAVMGAQKPDPFRNFGVKRGLMTGGTPCDLRCLKICRAVVMTYKAIVEHPRMFFVHKPNRPIKIPFLLQDRVI